jgi:hypothetical protein
VKNLLIYSEFLDLNGEFYSENSNSWCVEMPVLCNVRLEKVRVALKSDR